MSKEKKILFNYSCLLKVNVRADGHPHIFNLWFYSCVVAEGAIPLWDVRLNTTLAGKEQKENINTTGLFVVSWGFFGHSLSKKINFHFIILLLLLLSYRLSSCYTSWFSICLISLKLNYFWCYQFRIGLCSLPLEYLSKTKFLCRMWLSLSQVDQRENFQKEPSYLTHVREK